MMMQKWQENQETRVQLPWPWQPGGGQLFGDFAPSLQFHGVEVGEEERRGGEVAGAPACRRRGRMEGRLWVSREGGGEGDGGDTVHSVKCKVCLSSDSPTAKELGHRTIH